MKTRTASFLAGTALAALSFSAFAADVNEPISTAAGQGSTYTAPGTGAGAGATSAAPAPAGNSAPAGNLIDTPTAAISDGPTKPAPESAAAMPPAQEGIVKRGGEILFIKNGNPQRVNNELRLSEGITVEPDSDLSLKDGTRMTLTEGQMVTLDGRVIADPLSGAGAQSGSPLQQPNVQTATPDRPVTAAPAGQ